MRTLTMTFKLETGSTKTYTMQDPAEDLTQAQVFSVMQKMIDKEAVSVGGEKANGIKEAYIRISDREELA